MKKTLTCWGALAVVAVVALGTAAEAAQASVAPAVQDKIDALIQSQVTEGKTPGIAISIAKDGRTIYENAAGVRDIASKAYPRRRTF
jgi:CubicO group peptidase (beta-lactamase class C family)